MSNFMITFPDQPREAVYCHAWTTMLNEARSAPVAEVYHRKENMCWELAFIVTPDAVVSVPVERRKELQRLCREHERARKKIEGLRRRVLAEQKMYAMADSVMDEQTAALYFMGTGETECQTHE